MASANVDLVRSILADWERGDFGSTAWADLEIEFVVADGPARGSWHGLPDMAQAARDAMNAFEGYRIVAQEYRELDARRVLVVDSRFGRGKASGLDLDRTRARGAHLFEIRGGKVTRLVAYRDIERALADLGFS
jgi:ketosteroid isomerase-like protein